MISAFIFIMFGFGLAITIMEMVRKGFFQWTGKRKLQDESIKTLVRQASRWAVAAEQDKNIMISVLHANYGAGYLWAIKDIATSDQVYEATGIDLVKFESEIIKIQDEMNKRMFRECPSYGPPRSYLTQLSGESL